MLRPIHIHEGDEAVATTFAADESTQVLDVDSFRQQDSF